MTGKAKPKKHTAKEIAAKIDAATTNRGGGKAGIADRTGQEKGGHAKMECPHCKITAPDVKSMQIHHEARHPKIPFEEEKIVNRHASTSTSTQVAEPSKDANKPRPGVRGSLKKWIAVQSQIKSTKGTGFLVLSRVVVGLLDWVRGSESEPCLFWLAVLYGYWLILEFYVMYISFFFV